MFQKRFPHLKTPERQVLDRSYDVYQPIEKEQKVVVGQVGHVQMGVLLSRHPIELSKAKI